MNIGILNFSCGNINSLINSLKKIKLNFNIILLNKLSDFYISDKIIFPGQGSSVNCIDFLFKKKFINVIMDFININKLLGICVSKHIFYKYSEEYNTECLNYFNGFVKKFKFEKKFFKIPNIGWNKVKFLKNHFLFKNINNLSYFYFLHSYYILCENLINIYGLSKYNLNYPSIYINNNISLVQFHPEKSGKSGKKFLFNFINW